MKQNKNEMLNQVQHDKVGQNGRSMVEMLGVLAIIGVLSVAGIAGYSMAMKKYKANEIVNTASVLYTLAEAKYLTDSGLGTYNLSQAGLSKPSGISDMTYNLATKPGTIEITGAGDLCDTITSMTNGMAEYGVNCTS